MSDSTIRIVGPVTEGAPETAAPAAAQNFTPAPAADAAPVVTIVGDNPAPAVVAPAAEAPAVVESPAAAPAPVYNAYQELGLEESDFTKKALAAMKSREDFQAFAKILATDYDNMSPEALLRLEAKKQYPSLTEDQLDTQVELRMRQEFLQEDGGEARVLELGKAKLEAEASRIREGYKAEADKWQPTAAQPQAPQGPDPEEVRKSTEALLAGNPYMAGFERNPVIQIGQGEDAINYSVPNPKLVSEYAHDSDAFIQSIAFDQKDGKQVFNAERWTKAVAILQDIDGYENTIRNQALSMAEKKEFTRGYVPPKPGGMAPETTSGPRIVGRIS